MFKSTTMTLLWQTERVNVYLARIPLIYISFFHIFAVFLAEPSDLYTGTVWISVESVKRLLGCLPKWRDSSEWASGCQPRPSLPSQERGRSSQESGVWPGSFFSTPESSSAGDSGRPSLCCRKGNSLNPDFGFCLFLWG